MNIARDDSTTPPVFVLFAIAGGVLFLLGGILTAMTPDDRSVLIVAAIAFLLLGCYTIVVVLRHNRLVDDSQALADALEEALDRERGLRAKLAVTIREPVAVITSFSDRLASDPDTPADDRRLMLEELRASALEIDRLLAGLADTDGHTPEPRVYGVVRLDEELASVAASTIADVEFESWLEPSRAWGDAASVRQVLRAAIGGIRSSGSSTIVLKTDQRGGQAVATISGRCAMAPLPGIEALTGSGSLDSEDDWLRSLRSARDAVVAMGGQIDHTEALGVSHIVIEFPAAPEAIRPHQPVDRARHGLSLLPSMDQRTVMAVDLRPERPTASLRFS